MAQGSAHPSSPRPRGHFTPAPTRPSGQLTPPPRPRGHFTPPPTAQGAPLPSSPQPRGHLILPPTWSRGHFTPPPHRPGLTCTPPPTAQGSPAPIPPRPLETIKWWLLDTGATGKEAQAESPVRGCAGVRPGRKTVQIKAAGGQHHGAVLGPVKWPCGASGPVETTVMAGRLGADWRLVAGWCSHHV